MKRLFLVSMESQRSKYLFGNQFWAPRGNLVHLYGLKSMRAIMAPPRVITYVTKHAKFQPIWVPKFFLVSIFQKLQKQMEKLTSPS